MAFCSCPIFPPPANDRREKPTGTHPLVSHGTKGAEKKEELILCVCPTAGDALHTAFNTVC